MAVERYDVNLRAADLSDLSLLRRWDEKSHVITAKGADGEDTSDTYCETELARHPVWRELLVAETDDRPIGLIQIIDPAREETHYWGDVEQNLRAIDVWIGEEEDLGRGYGSQMMRLALAHCFASQHVVSVLVDPLVSNERAHHFYRRLGFRLVDRRIFGTDDCFVYRLDRRDWQTGVP